jgi:putative ABC transport system permease protein
MPAQDWRRLVRDHAHRTGADLPPAAIEELAAHLEDLYAGAIRSGMDDTRAMARVHQALDESSLAAIVARQHVRFRDPIPPGVPSLVRSSPLRSLSMWHALRLAIRQFTHQRSFALVTVIVLGLGVGASVTVYSVVDAVLLRPLPYTAPQDLVMLWDTNHEKGLQHEPISPVNFMDQRKLSVFADAAAWWRPDVNLVDPGLDPVRVKAVETSANLFHLLGVRPQVGPGFPDDGPFFSPTLVAVISDRLWRTRYQADPNIVGRSLLFNGTPYQIVGVMPARFDFPGEIDVWQRLRWDLNLHSRAAHFMEAVARLAPGADLARATAETTGLAQRLESQFPQTNRAWGARVVPLLEDVLGYYRPALIVLVGAVGLLFGIACFNVASLLLTRGISRGREMAVRTALGAAPRHLVVQLIAEGAVLSIAGAIAGTIAAAVTLPLLVRLTPVRIPRLDQVALQPRVLLLALGLAMITTLFFGLVPALLLRRRSLVKALQSSQRGVSRGSTTLYRLLVAGEVALAAALLVSSALLIRTVSRMVDAPLGVGNAHAFSASVQLSAAAYPDWPTVSQTFATLLDRVRTQPGIRNIGASNFLPLEPGWRVPFGIEGQPPARPGEQPMAQYHSVTDGYFEAFGAQLVAGRFLTDRDRQDTPGAVVVNQTFATRYLGGRSAVGQHLTTTSKAIGPLGTNLITDGRLEVMGVVADIQNAALGQPVEPAIYFTTRQYPFRALFVTIDAVDPQTALAALRTALHEIAPAVPLADMATWSERLSTRAGEPRVLMTLLVFFGALAALLASIGVYGLFSWIVALRRRELAIRLTLGARPAGVAGLVLRQGALLVIAGLAAGWLIIRLAEHAIARVLFQVSPADPLSTTLAGVTLFVAAIVACLPPALRAMRVQPSEGLRVE